MDLVTTSRALALIALSTLAPACGDDGSATTAATESAGSTATAEATGSTADVTSEGATTGESSASGSSSGATDTAATSDETSTGEASTRADTEATETAGSTGSTGSGTDTTGELLCEGEGQSPADWLINVIDGVYPDDVPENLSEECDVVEGEGLRLDCPSVELAILLTAEPMPTLPAPGAKAVGDGAGAIAGS